MTAPDEQAPQGGREMDRLIAEQVFGFWLATNPNLPDWGESWWAPHPGIPGAWVHASCSFSKPLSGHSYRFGDGLPLFSSDLDAAWKIVEWMHQMVVFGLENSERTRGLWRCTFGAWSVDAETAPLAICRAALQTAGKCPEALAETRAALAALRAPGEPER